MNQTAYAKEKEVTPGLAGRHAENYGPQFFYCMGFITSTTVLKASTEVTSIHKKLQKHTSTVSVACPLTNRRPNVQSLRHAKSCSKVKKILLTNIMYFQLKIA